MLALVHAHVCTRPRCPAHTSHPEPHPPPKQLTNHPAASVLCCTAAFALLLPQFIVLTNDDAITVISQPIILNITERHSNKNGCKMPATWYTSIQYTDPNLVKQVFIRGHGEH